MNQKQVELILNKATRDEFIELRNDALVAKNKLCIIRNKLHELINEAHLFRYIY